MSDSPPAMPPRRHWLLSPLHFAAYLTWATVFAGLLLGGLGSPRPSHFGALAIVIGMLVFIGAFLIESRSKRRQPRGLIVLLALLVEVAVVLALTWFAADTLAPVLLIIVAAQAAALPRRGRLALLGLANVLLLALLATLAGTGGLLLGFLYVGFQAFAGLTAHYMAEAERSRDALAAVNAHLVATRSLLEESARDGERLRLARELHDVAGHKLTALKLQLALLSRDPAGAPPPVAIASALAGELLDDLRAVVGQMRRHEGLDLRRAITAVASSLPHPRVHLDIAADARPADVAQAEALLRAAQEALTNAARHSAAQNAWLRLFRDGGRIVLEVRDDGRGAMAVAPGHGLTGMRERLQALGGDLALDGSAGFALQAWLPQA